MFLRTFTKKEPNFFLAPCERYEDTIHLLQNPKLSRNTMGFNNRNLSHKTLKDGALERGRLKQAALAVLLRVGLISLRNQVLASFQGLIAPKSHNRGQQIDAQPNSAVQLREYTVYMSYANCSMILPNLAYFKKIYIFALSRHTFEVNHCRRI